MNKVNFQITKPIGLSVVFGVVVLVVSWMMARDIVVTSQNRIDNIVESQTNITTLSQPKSVEEASNSTEAASLLLQLNSLVLTNDAHKTSLTARVRDAIGKPVHNVEVIFQSSNGHIEPSVVTTNEDGMATSTFTTDNTLGQIIITASVGTLVQQEIIQVVKTEDQSLENILTIAPIDERLTFGQQIDITAALYDANGQPISGELVTFFGSLGRISPASEVSDTDGQVTISYQAGNRAGSARITALSGVASTSVLLQIGQQITQTPTITSTTTDDD